MREERHGNGRGKKWKRGGRETRAEGSGKKGEVKEEEEAEKRE